MAGKSDYLENKIIDHVRGKTSYTMPTAYVGLYTAAPTDAGGGTEVSGNNYSRVTTAGADWTASSGGSGANANAITFPVPSGSWGTVTHFGLFDAATTGNLLYWAALTTSKTIGSGDTAAFGVGAFVITED